MFSLLPVQWASVSILVQKIPWVGAWEHTCLKPCCFVDISRRKHYLCISAPAMPLPSTPPQPGPGQYEVSLICYTICIINDRDTDYVSFDKIPEKFSLDTRKNVYCELLLDFLKDSKCHSIQIKTILHN